MKDEDKTKEQLLNELGELRQRIAELEASETERKRAEEALRESEEKYRDIVEMAPDGIVTVDLKGTITSCNSAFTNITGFSKNEIVGKHFSKLPTLRARDMPKYIKLFNSVIRGKVPRPFEARWLHKDGTVHWAEIHASLMKKGRKIIGFQAIERDITERKRAEEALKEYSERLEEMVEERTKELRDAQEETARGHRLLLALSQASQAVQRAGTPDEVYRTVGEEVAGLGYHALVLTLTDDRTYLALPYLSFEPAVLRATEKLTGLSAQDYRFPLVPGGFYQRIIAEGKPVFSKPSTEVIAEALPRPVRPLAGRLAALLGLEQGIVAPLTVDSETHGLLVVAGAGLSEADVPAVTAFANQIAIALENARLYQEAHARATELEAAYGELRDAQQQLIRKERLAVLGELAGGVGHELRNPLGVISNAVYYLQTILPDADETTKEYLEMIASEVHHSEKIVSDLLDFSRSKPADREEIAVSDLVGQLLERQPPPQDVKVTTKIASDLPPVFVDPRQIGQVLVNLVTNAYEAMPEGGRLTVKAEGEKDRVYLSITDTGCGISKENMERLFEPLFTTKARGIGLGLAVSKNLVEANGGSIEVESPSTEFIPSEAEGLRTGEEDKGSTFTIILPTKEVQS